MNERLNELKIEVTYNCPLGCVHCSSNAGADNTHSISKQKCLDIIQQAAELGVKEIAFSGGEPLIWDGLDEAVALCSHLGIEAKIYTSGNCDDIMGTLANLSANGLKKAIFSIYSPKEAEHVRVTRKLNSFQNTKLAIQACHKYGIMPEIHFVALASNYRQLPELVEFAKKLDIGTISILRFVPQGRGVAIERKDTLTKEQNLELASMINRIRKGGFIIRTGSPFNVLFLNDKPQCLAAQDRMIISPDLSIYPCDAFKQIPAERIRKPVVSSSLKNTTVADCWKNSSYLNAVREAVAKKPKIPCSACASYQKCRSGCLAQRFIKYNNLNPSCDPACLMKEN